MSGIEIAGLILGAFPVLICALESYRKSAEVVGDWWRIERAYKKCKQDLQYHRILFEINVEQFLLPLVVDDDKLKQLLEDPAGTAWEDPELEKKLQERLPKAYRTFLEVMIDMNELIKSFNKELGVYNPESHAQVTKDGRLSKPNASRNDLTSYSNFIIQSRRLKFSLKKGSRERLFLRLKDANEKMRNLLESSDRIVTARLVRETRDIPSSVKHKINEFWRHAKRLHNALTKAWRCSCSKHVAYLQLQHRTCNEVEFNILFELRPNPSQVVRRETMIRMIPNVVSTSPVGISLNIQRTISDPGLGGVRFESTPPVNTKAETETGLDQIEDLCSTLTTACPGCYGFLDEEEHHFVIYPGSDRASATQMSTVTLQELFQDARSMTRRKRYHLAMTLASSFLQLASTPWLTTPLKNDDIFFLKDSVHPYSTITEQPYIRREVSRRDPASITEAISSLGMRLLELCFGSPLESYDYRKLLGPGDPISAPMLDFAAAIHWSEMASHEAGSEFAEAIEWCLRAKNYSDGSWRKEFLTKVVEPLIQCNTYIAEKQVC